MLAQALRLAVLPLLIPFATAQVSVFVDPVDGDDMNSGLNVAQPVRTAARGLLIVQSQGNEPGSIVHMAPGTYSASLGEQFPLIVPAGVSLVAPREFPGATLRSRMSTPSTMISASAGTLDFDTRIVGLDLSGADRGIQINPFASGRVVIERCEISAMLTGVEVLPTASPDAEVQILDTAIRGCATGVRAEATGTLIVDGAEIQDCSAAGLVLRDTSMAIVNAKITSATVGVNLVGLTQPTDVALSGAVTDCQTGVLLNFFGGQTPTIAGRYLTIAGNDTGIDIPGAGGPWVSLDRSILHENGQDVAGAGVLTTARDSFIPSGSITGPGVLIVDPGFRDPVAGDFSLRRGALALDGFNVPSSMDAEDGNLDTIARRDYGGFEYLALRGLTEVRAGDDLDLKADGLAGGFAIGILDRSGAAAPGIDTTSGRLDMNVGSAERVARIPVDGSTGIGAWTVEVPSDPSLIGTTWRAQALSQSGASPTGFAFTNSIEFAIF